LPASLSPRGQPPFRHQLALGPGRGLAPLVHGIGYFWRSPPAIAGAAASC